MREKGLLVMVGGPSTVGKTEIINRLIATDTNFARPKSFTTHKPRLGAVSDDNIFECKMESEMFDLTHDVPVIDQEYGNPCAIDIQSIRSIIQDNKIAIKEVHPSKHERLRALFPDSVTAVFLPVDINTLETKRQLNSTWIADNTVLNNSIDIMSYDIVLYIKPDDSIDEITTVFCSKLHIYLKTRDKFPSRRTVCELNTSGYDAIAKEFTDEHRITTASFHEVSAPFFEKQISRLPNGCKCAELGPGAGWLRTNFRWPDVDYMSIEISLSMIRSHNIGTAICSDVFAMPIAQKSFDFIFASLADPFCHPMALSEIHRVLKPGGEFIFTLPAARWADAARAKQARWKTSFRLLSGESVDVYSFVFPTNDLAELLLLCGFTSFTAKPLYMSAEMLSRPVPPIIRDAAQAAQLPLNELPVVDSICVKR